MKRFISDDLRKWKRSDDRKPLILRGARQVGKTWALKEFGREFESVAYFDFDGPEEYRKIFEKTGDVRRILQDLSLASGQRITQDTLIVFDGIQSCDGVSDILKCFCGSANEYFVICAGPFFGLPRADLPMEKADLLGMGPMTFPEFLLADGDEALYAYLQSVRAIGPVPDAFFGPLCEKLKMYFVTGGMPAPVLRWTQDRDIALADRALDGILALYERDFGKQHGGAGEWQWHDVRKIAMIWESLPSQLARENKKFQYSAVKGGARAREYGGPLQWLVDAGLVKRVFRISKPGLPLSAYEDADSFKLYHGDVGLLRRQSDLSYMASAEGDRLFTEFKGALTENFVLQSLLRQFDAAPHYWAEPPYEVFVVQKGNSLIPIEVSVGENASSAGLNTYRKKYARETPLAVRLSLKNLSLEGNILNVPLFLTDRLSELIDMAQALV